MINVCETIWKTMLCPFFCPYCRESLVYLEQFILLITEFGELFSRKIEEDKTLCLVGGDNDEWRKFNCNKTEA